MEIRGRQYKAARGIVTHTAGTDTTEVIAGVTGKTLFLNYVIISVSDLPSTTSVESFKLTDGDAGTAFFFEEIGDKARYGSGTSKSLNFGEYGLALTEGNGLWVESSATTLDITVTALGYYK